MKPKAVSLAVAALLLGGCTLIPKYEQPPTPVAAQWPTGSAYRAQDVSAAGQQAADIGWRTFFADPQLQRLIETALTNNRDLQVSALNIQRAQAMYQIRRADLLPTVAVGASEAAQRVPGDLNATGQPMITRQYGVSVGLSSYELDFFGRIRSLNQQALELYLATEEAWRSAQISLVSEVANAYLVWLADRQRLQVAQETLKSQRQSYDLIKMRYDQGIVSELNLRQAQTSVEIARADAANYTGWVARDENALSLLLGTPALPEWLTADRMEDLGTEIHLTAGEVPSAVLQQRPDILAAEHRLKAANANIGAARAAFFPTISLTTSVGTASASLSGLFKAGSGVWAFAPQIGLPIFDSGRNLANLEVSETDRAIALAQYEKAIQSAFREVSDALAQRGTIDEQLAAQKALAEATAATFHLATARYEKGVDSYLTVLDAQRGMYSANLGLVGVQLVRQMNQVALYKSLGGGVDRQEYQGGQKNSP
ncbi:MAG: AdeC/AdeK/OprM family multidrug efflux complex outer membrane factor [Burkholderiales bacterium]|jgi:multidrug efflux system outer membrane protein|nr:AdeC/AdeK/OprM family multidrug efflux complex outer membrane factor [Burkholderiales bacterium]